MSTEIKLRIYSQTNHDQEYQELFTGMYEEVKNEMKTYVNKANYNKLEEDENKKGVWKPTCGRITTDQQHKSIAKYNQEDHLKDDVKAGYVYLKRRDIQYDYINF